MKNQKGSVLVFALIVLSFILVTAFSLASVSLIERRSSGVSVNSSTAFQNSDEGMEEFLQQIYKELDPNDDLAEMGAQFNSIYGSGYACVDSGGSPARLGSQDTEFIITAYRENPNPPIVDPTSGGWNSIEAIDDCGTALADVSRFRATGNYNNASRAVFLKLRDSLTRGLVAHWSFEDRAQIARVTQDVEDVNSFLAQDYSKQNHVLTLCNIDDDGDPLDINIINDDITLPFEIHKFDGCSFAGVGNGMNPKQSYNDTGEADYDVEGAWVEGVVEETPSDSGVFGDDSSEALYFNGSTYLATYLESGSCGQDDINCMEEADDKLVLENGVGISMWVKPDATNASGYLISKHEGADGYELYLNSGKVCFRLNDVNNCAGNLEIDDEWHHVAARWRDSDNKMEVFVDGEKASFIESFLGPIGDTTGKRTVIGAQSETIGNYFTGTIDDVRIWNRALTCDEIYRICDDAEQGTGTVTCTKDACAT